MFLLTAVSSGMYANTGPITTVHLTLIAVLIVVVVFAVLWGVRQKRARNAADAQNEATAKTLAAHPQTATAVVTAASDSDATNPTPEQIAAPATAAAPGRYRLIDVKGLGPKAVPLLDAQGVSDLAGLAALSADRSAQIDASLGALAGRMARDRWVEQAKLLSAGDVAGFEATFGRL